MLTLIDRELQDHVVLLVLGGLISAGMIAVAILTAYWHIAAAALVIAAITIVILFVLFCALGAGQMYTDRTNRVSSLLATSATTRSRILAARVLAGIVVIFVTLAPLLITAIIILRVIGAPLMLYRGTIAEVSATVVLASFACYSAGLLMGWTAIKTVPALGMLLLMVLLVLLLVIKGFGLQAIVLLLFFSIASLLRVWYRFTSVSL